MRRLDPTTPDTAAPSHRRAVAFLPALAAILVFLAGSTRDLTAQQGSGQGIQILRIGTVHPVNGPAIEDALVIIQNGKIVRIQPTGGRELPMARGAQSFPEAHAYPGFVDIHSAAFADNALLNDRRVDAGTEIRPGLDPFDERSRELVHRGVTTAYVHNRSTSNWRGLGAVIRPGAEGFDELEGDQPKVLHYRLDTSGAHPLARLGQLEAVGKEFEQLEKYEEAFEKYEEEKAKYDEELETYLSYHRKKNGIPEPSETESGDEGSGEEGNGDAGEEGGNEEQPSTEESGGGNGESGESGEKPERRRGRRGSRERPQGDRQEDPNGADTEGAGEKQGGDKKDGDKDKDAPKKPKAPKQPKRDPAKDALIALRDGEARLFTEASHPADIERVAEMIAEQELAYSVLEVGDGAAGCMDTIASYFSGVVVTDVRPREKSNVVPASGDGESIPVLCERAGVPFAIASGTIARARNLRTVAAEAVGLGISEQAALQAITLTPARLLGIEDRVGSLEEGKIADLNLFSGPIFDPSSRPVAVYRAGTRIPLAK